MNVSVNSEKCIGCEACEAVCSVGAITVKQGRALIDYDKCLSCGACVHECPLDAVSIKHNEF